MRRISNGVVLRLACAALLLASCTKLEPTAPANDEALDGPVEGLTYAEAARHLSGDVAFNNQVFTPETGLGPLFVATSCGACHAGDGKGHPFTTLTRFGQYDTSGNQYMDRGGPQLQNKAIPGYTPERIPSGATFSKLTPPAVTGLGFLELIPDADILALADPTDANGDGISGTPNWIAPPPYVSVHPGAFTQNGKYIGRFGKKAAAYDLLHQTVSAYTQDIGIVSSYNPIEVATGLPVDPEVSTPAVNDVVFYLQTLKAPVQRNQNDPDVLAGKNIFANIKCASCHTPQHTTGFSSVEALSRKTVFPYTDMLLHDMGPGLDDGYTEGSATTAEWKTPPLWGLGLSPNSQGGRYFLLHDGRAHSIEEAILVHGGEAVQSAESYRQLPDAEKQKLIRFLESL